MSGKISVVMPAFNAEHFICRAIESLKGQDHKDWELIVVNDGSSDNTKALLMPFLTDDRVMIAGFSKNRGMGAALNEAMRLSSGDFIAYLPADDIYFADHLSSCLGVFEDNPGCFLVFSGLRYEYNRFVLKTVDARWFQLVQVMHRRTVHRWVERDELVTDDLDRMFWSKLKDEGSWLGTGRISCEWVMHPAQRHKILREPEGGTNLYKQIYNVSQPLRFHTSTGNLIDEVEQYRHFRERQYRPKQSGLRILLVGELAYNPERVLALAERGHSLYGLWISEPFWYNTIGPLPFGHVKDLPRDNWLKALYSLQPDIIYAQLNWQAVPFAHEVLKKNPGIPFVWHFKEGPFICREKGTWGKLIDLYRFSDGQIYCSPEMKQWLDTILPYDLSHESSLILDGDLPKADYFTYERSSLLSSEDGELHTVVPGRPVGLHPPMVAELAANGIHLHFYGNFTHGQWKEWIERSKSLAPGYLHLHSQIRQDGWVKEFSKYDAGWLHFFESENKGEIRKANWDDLNMPARLSTLMAAGLPCLQRDNSGSIVATQTLVREHGLGVFFTTADELSMKLRDSAAMGEIRRNVWKLRGRFTFDEHAEGLVRFFKSTIERARSAPGRPKVLPFRTSARGRARSGQLQGNKRNEGREDKNEGL